MSQNKIDITSRLGNWAYLRWLVAQGYLIRTDRLKVYAVKYLDA